ncbi:hypothetical protein MHYMCMPASI_00852 [Hyalomma marginatum]|uniref:Uncharacterized protein n=1 Tax=Hyalomma marginatum TaxID=34627 RepID=A0A8S4C334_9ACAR|nr:hypothetical protein MHYMCMPASI_00852 [Hyalomma marginatum]
MLKEILHIGFTDALGNKTENLVLGKEQQLQFDHGTSLIQQYEIKNDKYYYGVEKLFSHLLFYSGYLAAISCDDFACTFTRTYNYEVREEFKL